MMFSFPASAASGRPNTGAETKCCPAFVCSAASRSASPTLIVLREMCTPPIRRVATKPPSPNTTLSTALSSASIVRTISCAHAPATETGTLAPSARNSSERSQDRLKTVTRCPARSRFLAMPCPILPSPMNPTFIESTSRPGIAVAASAGQFISLFDHGNRFDLHQKILAEQPAHLNRRAGRRISRVDVLVPDLAECSQLREVHEIAVELNHVLEAGSSCFERRLQVLKHLLHLRFEIAFPDHVSRPVERYLSGNVDRVAGPHYVRVTG